MRDTWVTVGTAPTLIIPAGSGTANVRAEALIYNSGPTTVWVGTNSANLGVDRGFPIGSGTSATFAVINEPLYARVTVGTQVVSPLVVGAN
jgi:hypothetical protein